MSLLFEESTAPVNEKMTSPPELIILTEEPYEGKLRHMGKRNDFRVTDIR